MWWLLLTVPAVLAALYFIPDRWFAELDEQAARHRRLFLGGYPSEDD